MAPFRTVYLPHHVDSEIAKVIYDYALQNISWEESIRSRRRDLTEKERFTRMGAYGEDDVILSFIASVLSSVLTDVPDPDTIPSTVTGVYMNHYRNGHDWCPRHSHPDTVQMIISLGATRTLTVGTKNYKMSDGDVIIFGASLHGIVPEPEVTEGRISIAVFLQRSL